ncbi:MAG: hypothetical protein BGP09_19800 [Rhizobium sp. 60-20]|nr:MAG: hypothetical protein BGP09_19800 [Rhizobium sp. 60-20]
MWEGAKAHPVFVFVAICIIGFGFVAVFALVKWAKGNAARVATAKCLELAREHQRALLAKKRQNLLVGDYGEVQRAGFDRELDYFLATVVLPQIQPQLALLGDPHLIGPSRIVLRDLIEREVCEFERVSGHKLTADLPIDPLEFELWCTEKLKSKGWKARITKASGDQGADIIASWKGAELVAQCKLYSKPVGNKAVQEVAAARLHYSAEFAAVISTSGYTR